MNAVPPTSVVSSRYNVHSFDLETIKYQEMDFKQDFVLSNVQGGKVTGFSLSFDVGFDGNTLSTGSQVVDTHWHQTVLYLQDVKAVSDTIQGSLSIKRNLVNQRELDIVVVLEGGEELKYVLK